MSNDTMIVTMTVSELQCLIRGEVRQALSDTLKGMAPAKEEGEIEKDFTIGNIKELQRAYNNIGYRTAQDWRQKMIAAGVGKGSGKKWWVMKSEADEWLKTNRMA